ncbi:hypothetical protein MY11210_005519 [Beauveria gryllotalpidicola]
MSNYDVDEEVAAFFKKTTASRAGCQEKARSLTGSDRVLQIPIQGDSSYSMYAGAELEYVVHCRLRSLALRTDMYDLATEIYGPLVPAFQLHGELGSSDVDDEAKNGGKEPLLVYLMPRLPGITQLDFALSRKVAESSPEFFPSRQNFFTDVASFFARSWLAPQSVSLEYRENIKAEYGRDLKRLLNDLPERFQPYVETCLASLDDIMSLPMVLVHNDFGCFNLLVDEASCHLKGVVDWAEATIGPFGLNLHSIRSFEGQMHLRNGWSKYPDYDALEETFWAVFTQQVGSLSDETIRIIKRARLLGLLRSHGFTSRLANEPEPVPLRDDDNGRYNMLFLDGYLINPATRLDGVD